MGKPTQKKILSSYSNLNKWIDKNGWKGYDPYDIKGIKSVIYLSKLGNKYKILAYVREIVFELISYFPVFSRKIVGIKPAINAKAMGLFSSAFLSLYKVTSEEVYKQKAEICIAWLLENKTETNSGWGWGYPFNWQSTKFIPANTPNGIVTTAVGDAFWKLYKTTGENNHLEACEKIASFLFSLPFDEYNGNLCYSYTPLFINHVHNLNLFVAEYLIKIGIETNNSEWVDAGNKAVNYTLSCQLRDGSFDYNGPPEKPQNLIDNYHTGFNLRMLHSVWKLTQREDVFLSLGKCYQHYISNFFENNEIPKFTPKRKYRIDIHSCAESVNCLSELSVTFPESTELAAKILNWTIDNLQHNTGYFYYGIFKSRFTGRPFISKIPYMRWSQAWMLKAFSNYFAFSNTQITLN